MVKSGAPFPIDWAYVGDKIIPQLRITTDVLGTYKVKEKNLRVIALKYCLLRALIRGKLYAYKKATGQNFNNSNRH